MFKQFLLFLSSSCTSVPQLGCLTIATPDVSLLEAGNSIFIQFSEPPRLLIVIAHHDFRFSTPSPVFSAALIGALNKNGSSRRFSYYQLCFEHIVVLTLKVNTAMPW